jgi:hypothetical protein
MSSLNKAISVGQLRREVARRCSALKPSGGGVRAPDSPVARGLGYFRWHDDGATVWIMIVDGRSRPAAAITFHSSIK